MTENEFRFWTIMLSALGALTAVALPVIIFWLSSRFEKRLRFLEHNYSRVETLVDLRAKKIEFLSEKLNMIFCFCFQVGNWKDNSPEEIIALKRETDRIFFSTPALWPKEVMRCYQNFMDICFESKRGPGNSIRIRADILRFQSSERTRYEKSWDEFFMLEDERKKWIAEFSVSAPCKKISYRIHILRPAFIEMHSAFHECIFGKLPNGEYRKMLEDILR